MFSNKVILAIDAGGTSIKYALLDDDKLNILYKPKFLKMPSFGKTEEILDTFSQAIQDTSTYAEKKGLNITKIGLSVPGPFDCRAGISYMKHKWPSIYGLPLRHELYRRTGINKDVSITFIHDIHAFLIGEYYFGKASQYGTVAGIILGTGLGFGLIKANRILVDNAGNPLIRLFSKPYRHGILEDYTTGPAISRIYHELSGGEDIPDAREIATRAEAGDLIAQKVYSSVGKAIGENVFDIFGKLEVECVVFGGRVALAFNLFEEAFKNELNDLTNLKFIYASKKLEISALKGAAFYSKYLDKYANCENS